MTREERLEKALRGLVDALSESGVFRRAGCGCHEDVSFPSGGWEAVLSLAKEARAALAPPVEAALDVPVPLNLPPWRPTRDEYRAATERLSPRPRIEQDDEPAEPAFEREAAQEVLADLVRGYGRPCHQRACGRPATKHDPFRLWCDEHAPPDAVDLPRAPLVRGLRGMTEGGGDGAR